ncbi:S-adenosyl-L-methionine-dependent methyltransferase [Xylariaceae sp. FL0016]|nr:S-adenosyl-L-methionine-dependent methyltransferase [Xylariaceae sp. FL0016]
MAASSANKPEETAAPVTSTESEPKSTGGENPAAPAGTTATTTATTSTPEPTAATSSPPANILPASYWQEATAAAAAVHEGDGDGGDDDDADSAYGDDNNSSTASLSASILEYRTLHGRTFHSERGNAQSWNPNDAQHDETMNVFHHVATIEQDGKIFLAPISDSVHKVLDVGCGTGSWAIDFADQFPGAEVIGVDISPQQPQWIPPNLRFEMDDVTQPWTYAPNSFDYVHSRWLIGAIPDWDVLFKEVFQATKPGGYYESRESSPWIQSDDDTVRPETALGQWGRVFAEAGKKFGRSFQPIEDDLQRKAMEKAGFVDIKEYNFKTPVGSWPANPKLKEIGGYNRYAMEQDIEGLVLFIWSTVMGWSKEEIHVYAAHVRRELRSGKSHAYYPQRVLVGRKPETA